MLFNFFKRLFGLADEGSRKRRAEDTDYGLVSGSGGKRYCCEREIGRTRRSMYMDENNEEEVEYLGTSPACSPAVSRERTSNRGTSCSRKKLSTYGQESSGACRKIPITLTNGKSNFGSRCATMSTLDARYSTLTKTNQLREKQEYGQLLQRFLPQKTQPLCAKTRDPETNRRQVTEVIDLEKYETPVKDARNTPEMCRQPVYATPAKDTRNTPETFRQPVYGTPATSTPLRWYTPRQQETSLRARAKDDDVSILAVRRSLETSRPKADEISILKVTSPRDKCEIFEIALGQATTSKTPEKSPMNHQSRNCVEIIRTNTLRDNLAAKAVIKDDFVPRVSKHYNERLEQRMKEAEELKRMTSLLSKHNRVAREAALEEQLTRSMRLCEAVLDETEISEESPLPELTAQMQQKIRQALVPNPPNEVLVEAFGLRITRKDIHTLSGLNWLNDEVINFYMNLLIVRGTDPNYPKVHAMNTFFYPKLLSSGHSSLKRWTRKIDVLAQDILVVPIHLGIHWCMSIVDFRDKSIRYYDSMGGANPTCLATLRQYLEDESMDKRKKHYDTSDWTLESMKKIPQQMNGSDCGVFSCMFAEFITANRRITFSQQDMPYFRNKMVYEILEAKLL